jgi:hypothetical protein
LSVAADANDPVLGCVVIDVPPLIRQRGDVQQPDVASPALDLEHPKGKSGQLGVDRGGIMAEYHRPYSAAVDQNSTVNAFCQASIMISLSASAGTQNPRPCNLANLG